MKRFAIRSEVNSSELSKVMMFGLKDAFRTTLFWIPTIFALIFILIATSSFLASLLYFIFTAIFVASSIFFRYMLFSDEKNM
ncbi:MULTISPECIES: hypothetical protein [Cysteiniphilum]|uniref:Uncharacterized protein n=1 Tax=Cysteiniphilum litorale TaxID=2056700 RepID=A0A8J2Z314_9GAMM|nr:MULTISPECIES: hypothetical protein [Cysteiniphilum]GGF91514.1 hypothetical protein GCM10010995_05920 [Cysteiniphilum litorale]